MKEEQKIYQDYLKYNPKKPLLFGKQEHWENFLDGYEVGYQAAVEESQASLEKELGFDLKNFPFSVDEQFAVMRKALQDYYKSKK
ncbi:MAG: hypothetical protein UV82_C0007G0056 [Candidatus Magasanikbacteria bacterium GW2011_GWD2_43_18]|uniref:Uncharacterized protein n=1 Tax=Candidatus Magasanikbacteria bacterium GW2011_GWE2_42_7 TaxID=1619052 RepID=A0A0G1BAE2_9BACT|nr:MAG: hypothetical protein UV18_C0011G0017 [Candidatus Magasanikbacteria bacterium GW2011_GWC2_42_27]KKS70154.1 MAG: hypothetical protein UV42_C0067G0011 [Candidatus Magasanikbacteria bacterium GW2011_GWE2_42_7]KKT04556.1 MAG: hypothetical protein UV82_C0007G0056 [Candidatus Magasanikbacteria bacterium GW2011_GWD2_43_18]KKT23470.1 MAG: hypothetical protein UW10_C0034G0009 [Candidatus Magasanikbacteria bacterium GW2011_GWA2_43_9]HBB38190.1 hypothetical protein [Candidatus Magasanikbacteria bac